MSRLLVMCYLLALGNPFAAVRCAADDFSGAKLPAADQEKRVILILGDSLSAGLGLSESEAYPALLQAKLDDAGLSHFEVVNAGVSGDTSAGGLRRIDWLLKRRVDIFVLELGTNDGLRGVDLHQTKSNLQAIIDKTKLRFPNAVIIIAGMMLPPNLGPDYAAQFKQLFTDLARDNQAALVPFLLEGVAARPEFNQEDIFHPNAAGQKILAENVWKILEPIARKLR